MTDRRHQLGAAGKWRIGWVAAGALCTALAGTLVQKPAPVLLWNASPSSPVGLYRVRYSGAPGPGDTAIAWPPRAVRRLAARRHYLPAGVPLVKKVAAAAGARVCASGPTILVNGRPAALRHSHDRAGRPLPWWSGCRALGRGDLLLLSPGVSEAFDGRYFGITRPADVIGEGELLWKR